MSEAPIVEARALTKRYGQFLALDRVSFSVATGEVVGFLGLNGAGKTTTLRILAGYQPPTEGAAAIAGFDTVRRSEEARGQLGYLPERVPLHDDMRVQDYLTFRARLKGVRGSALKPALERVIGRCGLESKRRSWIAHLSKGYRQRVGLADALVHDPALLILDEPTSGLDPDQRVEMRELLREVGERRTVLLSSHILPEVEAIADRILVIHRGRLRTSATMEEIRSRNVRFSLRYAGAPLPEHAELPELERDGEGTRLWTADRDTGRRWLASVTSSGRELLEYAAERPSLEQVFMAITSGREEG